MELKFNIRHDLKNEIHSCKLALNIKNKAKEYILNQLINLADEKNNTIYKDYTYETINKKKYKYYS